MNDAAFHLNACIAELHRADGLFRGPLTAAKKRLLTQRLKSAGQFLADAYWGVHALPAAPDPLNPAADLAANVIPLNERRSCPGRR